MRVFITGFSGYVGSHVAASLAARGHSLSVLAHGDQDRAAAGRIGYEVAGADLGDTGSLAGAVKEADAVVHCAASDDPGFLPLNQRAVAAMLGALRPGQAFAMHGGSMVYGDTGTSPHDPDAPFAPPPPLSGRAALDRTVLDHGRIYDLRTFVVYGALVHGGAGAMIPHAMVEAARKAGFSAYVGDGAQRWSSVHVEDWAELIALTLEQGPPGGHAFVAAGPPITMREAAGVAASAVGRPDAVCSIGPDEAGKLWQAFGPAFAMSQWFSADKAERLLGWRPRDRDLDASFAEAAAGPQHG